MREGVTVKQPKSDAAFWITLGLALLFGGLFALSLCGCNQLRPGPGREICPF